MNSPWPACADKPRTLETLLARSEVVCIGIDGGGLGDLLATTVIGRERATPKWLEWCPVLAHGCPVETQS